MGDRTDFLRGSPAKPMAARTLAAAFLYLPMATRVFGMLATDRSLLLGLRAGYGTANFRQTISDRAARKMNVCLAFHLVDYLFVLMFYSSAASTFHW